MGLCSSKSAAQKAAERRDREIDEEAQAAYDAEAEKVKLLLLGAGESGKSTIFKQMKILYGEGFKDKDREDFKSVVYANIIQSMRSLVKACKDLDYEVKEKEGIEAFERVTEDQVVDEDLAAVIKRLWGDPGIQEAYANRKLFQLNDSAKYYFEKVDAVAAPDYLPSVNDVLKCRIRTSGIVVENYIIDGVTFVMYDVGGQRNERKKWIHCFDDVTAVIFVAAISEYDQVLYEEATKNRMLEAMDLFAEVCNSKWFAETCMLLFLNKRDLFEDKIKIHDIRAPDPANPSEMLFDDYTGGHDYDAGVEYFSEKFRDLNLNKAKPLYINVTCATDTSNVKVVFSACKETILEINMRGSGFMG